MPLFKGHQVNDQGAPWSLARGWVVTIVHWPEILSQTFKLLKQLLKVRIIFTSIYVLLPFYKPWISSLNMLRGQGQFSFGKGHFHWKILKSMGSFWRASRPRQRPGATEAMASPAFVHNSMPVEKFSFCLQFYSNECICTKRNFPLVLLHSLLSLPSS